MLYDRKWERSHLEPWRKLLLDAADYMELHGHAKNSAQKADGSVCFVGALSMAATGSAYRFGDTFLKTWSSSFEENVPMVQAFKKMAERCGGYPVEWNNDKNRSGEEVIAGMRECAVEPQDAPVGGDRLVSDVLEPMASYV